MQAKELSELRAQVDQDKSVNSCLRQELDDVNKVFLARVCVCVKCLANVLLNKVFLGPAGPCSWHLKLCYDCCMTTLLLRWQALATCQFDLATALEAACPPPSQSE